MGYNNKILHLCYLGVFILSSYNAQAQTDSLSRDESLFRLEVEADILNMNVEEGLENKVSTLFNTEESLFTVPAPIQVLTGEELRNSGVLTLEEAFRLTSGMLVRQRTKGNYDVHIRGNDQIGGRNLEDFGSSKIQLMIDGVPYYDTFMGGILWESLPVGLNDILRIEIYAGGASGIGGINSTSGLIHIVTRQVQENQVRIRGNFQGDGQDTYAHTGSLSAGIRDKFYIRVSGNYKFLERFEEDYYLIEEGRDVVADSLLFFKAEVENTNLFSRIARTDYGGQLQATYRFGKQGDISLYVGRESSRIQDVIWDDTLNLTQRLTENTLGRVSLHWGRVWSTLSYQQGEIDYALGYSGNRLDVGKIDANVSYLYTWESLRLMPSVFYHQSSYDDQAYLSAAQSEGRLQGSSSVGMYGGSIRGDWQWKNRLRVLGFVGYTLQDSPSETYLTYHAGASYQPLRNHLLYVSYGTGQEMVLVDDAQNHSLRRYPTGENWTQVPNTDLQGLRLRSLNVGYRFKILQKFQAEGSFFLQEGQNYLSKTFDSSTNTVSPSLLSFRSQQWGWSGSVETRLNKLDVKGFVTYQQTDLTSENSQERSPYTVTPSWYGGLVLNYSLFFEKLNINTSVYMYSSQEWETFYGREQIASRWIPNAKLSYRFWKENAFYINARNFLNEQLSEYPLSDKVGALYLAGFDFSF